MVKQKIHKPKSKQKIDKIDINIKDTFDIKALKETIWKLDGDRNLVANKDLISTAMVEFAEDFLTDILNDNKNISTIKGQHILDQVSKSKYRLLSCKEQIEKTLEESNSNIVVQSQKEDSK